MLRYLADYSLSHWAALRTFNSITLCSLLALLLAFGFALWWLPKVIAFLRQERITENMNKESELIQRQHALKVGTVTMGGVGIALAFCGAALLLGDWDNPLVIGSVIVFLGNGAIGFLDDLVKLKGWRKHGLNKRQKTLGLLVVSAIAAGLLAHSASPTTTKILFPFTNAASAPDLGWAYYLYFIFVIYACANAVNLTDGLDGLATGCSLSTTLAFGVFAYVAGNSILSDHFNVPYIAGSGELLILATGLIGALLGFLWFNANPAQIFMGDTGSLAIGGFIGYVALVCKQEIPLILAGGIFVIESLSVIIQIVSFRGWQRRVFLCAPLHHHLELKGWKENHIVVRFWMLGALCAGAALGTLKMH